MDFCSAGLSDFRFVPFLTSCELQIAQIVDLVDRLVSLSFSPSVSRSVSVDMVR